MQIGMHYFMLHTQVLVDFTKFKQIILQTTWSEKFYSSEKPLSNYICENYFCENVNWNQNPVAHLLFTLLPSYSMLFKPVTWSVSMSLSKRLIILWFNQPRI